MKERPIVFSKPMVRAILDGRKTQTRRVITPQPDEDGLVRPFGIFGWSDTSDRFYSCKYGKKGDQLWVRENGWEPPNRTAKMMREGADTWADYYYDADGITDIEHEQFKQWGFKRRPSIHMPRWASRIQLGITGIRVERLQDISEADALAEGVESDHTEFEMIYWVDGVKGYQLSQNYAASAKEAYQRLWESINGHDVPIYDANGKKTGMQPNPARWEANPWVWVVEFRRAA